MIKKNLIIIIPARMNSKGIKKKNLKKINNKSLINITINQAIKLKPKKIYVSSEDEKIQDKIINKKKINFHKRNAKLSKDNTHTIHVVLDIIKNYKISDKTLVAMMLPTYPLREITKIKSHVDKFNTKKYYSLIGVTETKFYENNIRFLDKSKNLTAENFNLKQRQKSKKVFFVNGSFFLSTCKNLIKFKNFHSSKKMKPIFCNPKLSIDINDTLDLRAAKKYFN
jgi:CMP-N-acetylneuraminic acid synthetase